MCVQVQNRHTCVSVHVLICVSEYLFLCQLRVHFTRNYMLHLLEIPMYITWGKKNSVYSLWFNNYIPSSLPCPLPDVNK